MTPEEALLRILEHVSRRELVREEANIVLAALKKPVRCLHCNGTGSIKETYHAGDMETTNHTCAYCKGKGFVQ